MRHEYCDMTSIRDCTTNTDGCYLCGGFCSKDRALVVQHVYLETNQTAKSKEICNKYMNRLTYAFWAREIELFLPTYKKTITTLGQEPEGGEGKKAHKRQGNFTDDGSGQQFSPKAKRMNDFMKTKAEKKMQFDKIMLKGTSSSQSLVNYLRKVRKNRKILKK